MRSVLPNLHPMVYPVIKVLVRLATAVFFRRIIVNGREHIPVHGPLIVVANHPNTLMDPLLVAALLPQRIGFVANAGLFANRLLVAFFRYFHVIPIFRKKDVAPGEKPDNTQSFAQCHAYLAGGGTFLIFPEGSSHYELNLREIRTGTARIALSYEAARDFKGGLQIQPVALDYSDAIQFRSMVAITCEPPIPVAAFAEAHHSDEAGAVETLTEAIRRALAQHVPWTTGKDQEDLLIKAHAFYTAYAEPGADLHADPKRSLALRKQLADALHFVQAHRPDLYAATRDELLAFFHALREDGLTTGFHSDAYRHRNTVVVIGAYLLEFVALLPLYAFGLATNYLPYIIPSRVFNALRMEIEYKAPVQLVTGLLTFPLYYGLVVWAFRSFVTDAAWATIALLVLLPISGFTTLWYWTELQRCARVVRFHLRISAARKEAMLKARDGILARMAEARRSLSGA